ncbi:hypothetical protein F2Q70_00036183 [Brassica cretica]|uniref:Uncharacterized protein n=1 Tax=Brassica cretica TaxID=69181 RepID=A0A8S9JR06_BRACR|nr:hypothetical protein F2Q70_00036183 [Brassica cretica]
MRRSSRPIRDPPFAAFLASEKCISWNCSSDSNEPSGMTLKLKATGDLPVETCELPLDFIITAQDILTEVFGDCLEVNLDEPVSNLYT